MGLSFGFGFGPFRASTQIGGRGRQGDSGGDEEFWLFLFIVLGLASGVPLALSDVWGLATDVLTWGWLFLGALPSCAMILFHARQLSTLKGGRLTFNSGATALLSLPAGGYSFIVLFALTNQSGARWFIFLSLIPFGILHLFWVRWTIWIFSSERQQEKLRVFNERRQRINHAKFQENQAQMLSSAEKQTEQARMGIFVRKHVVQVENLLRVGAGAENFESQIRHLFKMMREQLLEFSNKWGMRAETKELEVAELAELVFKQTGIKDL
jgi:hypothetical protein